MENKKNRILFVEDEKVDRITFEKFACEEDFPFDYILAESVKEATDTVKSEEFDAVIIDYLLGDGTAFNLFDKIKDAPIIIITSAGDQEIAVKAMKAGAYDYLIKDDQNNYLKTLPVTIQNAIKHKKDEEELNRYREHLERLVEERTIKLQKEVSERKRTEEKLRNTLIEVKQLKDRFQTENVYLQDEIKLEHNFEKNIGNSKNFKNILSQVEQVAPTDSTVLILGETGTGKELIARAIHNISDRKDRPLVKVDCAAIPSNLIESELFGHERGAFTGAHNLKIGRFELADGGTIFLDEIGDLPLELQKRLLRILQDEEFVRLGSSDTIKVDVRIIAATNRNLKEAMDAGYFRQDLYYRLNVFPIETPPLRDRKDDIPLLVNHFVKKYCAKQGKKIENIPVKAVNLLQAYHWPGNIRELENIIERAVVLTIGSTLKLDGLLDHHPLIPPQSDSLSLKKNECFLILKALKECNWGIKGKHGAAARLDIPASTLRNRMIKYSIKKQL